MVARRHLRFLLCAAILGFSVSLQAQARPQRVRVSEKLFQTMIISRVQPPYPEEARAKHIQGSVVMQAEISKEGIVEGLRVLSGDPLLAPAATTAVKQWKFKPFQLDGQPVPVETQITVNFSLVNK